MLPLRAPVSFVSLELMDRLLTRLLERLVELDAPDDVRQLACVLGWCQAVVARVALGEELTAEMEADFYAWLSLALRLLGSPSGRR